MLNKSVIPFALLLSACGYPVHNAPVPTPPGDVTLAASPPQASAGSTIVLSLANGSALEIGYNLCTSALQSASGTVVQTDRVCTMELRILAPGATATYNHELPASLPAGTYRFSTSIERMQSGDRTSVTSNAFEVR